MWLVNLRLMLLIICCVFVAACIKLPRHVQPLPLERGFNGSQIDPAQASTAQLIDINIATAEELERLPGIGAGFAARIIEHRARYGHFRRKEQLLIVRGMGERRYRELEPFITVGANEQ